jgi:hypothetical protein
MSLYDEHFPTCVGVAHGHIRWLVGNTAPDRDSFAVRAESHGLHAIVMFRESEEFATRLGIPDLRRLVFTAGHDALTIGADCHASHESVCPLSARSSWPVSESQTFAELS